MKTRTGKILVGLVALLAFIMCFVAYFPRIAKADSVEVAFEFVPFTSAIATPMTGWYKVQEGQMYDKANNDIAAAPTWTDCVTAISVDSSTGVYEDTPETAMPTGWYIWRLWDNSSASTDAHIKAKLIYWNKGLRRITHMSDL